MDEPISDEARAKHHEALRLGIRGIYTGLTYWAPNINIFHDPPPASIRSSIFPGRASRR